MIKLLGLPLRKKTPVITYRAATQPLRRAIAGETGSHFLTGACDPDGCYVTAWRRHKLAGHVMLCDHGRIQPASVHAAGMYMRELPYFAPLCR